MDKNSKELTSPDGVSKQLEFADDTIEDTGRYVKTKQPEKKKKAKQKMDEFNDDESVAAKPKKVPKNSDKTPAKDRSENVESSTTPGYKRSESHKAVQDGAVARTSTAAMASEASTSAIETGDTFQMMLQAALDTATLMAQRGASPATVNEWLQRTLQAAMPMAAGLPRPSPSPPPPPSLAATLSTTTTCPSSNDICSTTTSPATTQATAEPTNVATAPITPSTTPSLPTTTPTTPVQLSNIALGHDWSSTQSMLAPSWPSPWQSFDRPPWQPSRPDEGALLEKIKATCKAEEVQSVSTLMGKFTEIALAVEDRRQQISDWVNKVCPELPLETKQEAIIVTREMGNKLSSACSSHWPLGTASTEVNKKHVGKQIEKLLRDAVQEGKPERGGAGRGLSTQFRLTALGLPGDLTAAYNQQAEQLLIALEEARLLTLILAILCGNCIYVLDNSSMSASQLRQLKLDSSSVKTTELLQKFTLHASDGLSRRLPSQDQAGRSRVRHV
jgi:hypothetical protein